MSRWTQYRTLQTLSEEIPENSYEARVFLDNAYNHIRNSQLTMSRVDAQTLIISAFDELLVTHD